MTVFGGAPRVVPSRASRRRSKCCADDLVLALGADAAPASAARSGGHRRRRRWGAAGGGRRQRRARGGAVAGWPVRRGISARARSRIRASSSRRTSSLLQLLLEALDVLAESGQLLVELVAHRHLALEVEDLLVLGVDAALFAAVEAAHRVLQRQVGLEHRHQHVGARRTGRQGSCLSVR